jgi:beta-lactamase class A
MGISAINTAKNEHIHYRENERFLFCSASKVMSVAAILKRSMHEANYLQKNITYKSNDLVTHSPITEKNIALGMMISELSGATLTTSDNTAMNLLLKELGGTSAVTKFARSIGDSQFRLDRWEPELSSSIPGDKRDTTTPRAMEISLEKLVLGKTLVFSLSILHPKKKFVDLPSSAIHLYKLANAYNLGANPGTRCIFRSSNEISYHCRLCFQ